LKSSQLPFSSFCTCRACDTCEVACDTTSDEVWHAVSTTADSSAAATAVILNFIFMTFLPSM